MPTFSSIKCLRKERKLKEYEIKQVVVCKILFSNKFGFLAAGFTDENTGNKSVILWKGAIVFKLGT